ncbi:MAG: DUF6580 family putative transport protein [Bacteroidota bacterium]
MNSRMQLVVGTALVVLAALSRLIPHPMNFAPITAIALFGGMYFDKRFAPVLPFLALLISDYFIGFYDGIMWVYGSFIVSVGTGMWLKSRKSVPVIAAATVANSILFFVISNFGVWYSELLYPRTFAGLVECYTLALPFFRNTLAGDLFYVAVMFGAYEILMKYLPKAEATKA